MRPRRPLPGKETKGQARLRLASVFCDSLRSACDYWPAGPAAGVIDGCLIFATFCCLAPPRRTQARESISIRVPDLLLGRNQLEGMESLNNEYFEHRGRRPATRAPVKTGASQHGTRLTTLMKLTVRVDRRER